MKYPLLALLARGPGHGYELKRSFEERFGAIWPPLNIGQIYTTLQRLERDELARSEQIVQDTRPNKRVYEITEAGREALDGWMRAPSGGTRIKDEFFLKLVLASLIEAGDPVALIDEQRVRYLRSLREVTDLGAAAEDRVTALLAEGAALHLQADLRWLDLFEQQLFEDEQP